MAINPESKYPGKIAPSSADYPYGQARNITTPGDGTGTPWEAGLVNDLFGWQQSLLKAGVLTPTGTPESVGSSQYLDAMSKIFGRAYATLAAAAADTTLKEGNRVVWLSPVGGMGEVVAGGNSTTTKRYVDAAGGLQIKVSGQHLPLASADMAAAITIPHGDDVYVYDKFGGTWWTSKENGEIIEGESGSDVTFTDEINVILNDSQALVLNVARNMDVLRRLEHEQYEDFFMNSYSKDVALTVNCYGDSITYGQALASTSGATDRIGDPTNFGDGSTYAHWQYDENYPKVLGDALNAYSASSFTANNRGFSGDRAINMYLRQRNVPDAGVAIIMIGVNDALFATSNGSVLNGIRTTALYSVDDYAKVVRRFVAREIVRGNTVVLLGNQNITSAVGWDGSSASATKTMAAYDTALASIAAEFGVMFVDTRRDLTDLYATNRFTQEAVHPNEVGHFIFGNRLASLLLGSGYKRPEIAYDGTKLLTNSASHNVASQSVMPLSPNTTSVTPPFLNNPNQFTVAMVVGEPVVFSFYCASDDTVVFPALVLQSGASATIKLDAGAEQQEYLLDEPTGFPFAHNAGYPAAVTASPASEVTVTNGGGSTARFNRSNTIYGNANQPYIHIAGKGWHTLEIESDGGLIDGLQFAGWDSVRANIPLTRAKFNGFGAVGNLAIDSGYNVASVTKNGTGDYTVTFGRAFDNNDYAMSICAYPTGPDAGVVLVGGIKQGTTQNTTDVNIQIVDMAGVATDGQYVAVIVDGDTSF